MKYWLLTTEFPPFHGGGISTYCLHTGLMLTAQGHEVTVFVPEHGISTDIAVEKYESIKVIRFRPVTKPHFSSLGYSAALSFLFAELVLDEIARHGAPDYIETQDYHGIGYYLMLRKKLGEASLEKIPVVLTAHAPSFFYLQHNQAPVYTLPDYWTGEMEKWTMKAADIFISPSQYLVDNVAKEIGQYKEQYNVIRNPYKLIAEKEIQPTFNKGDIVFFGKLTYQKGCLSLLKYLSKLWDDGFEHTIRFIGADHYFNPKQSGMQDHLVKKYKRYYEAGKFSFEGKLTPDQLNNRLAKAHLIIVPSVVDNFPYAVVESMLLGKVLLVSDGGGQAEMIDDGKTGFIYEHDNTASFEKKIKAALALSEAECKAMGSKAKASITQLCNYGNVYREKMRMLSGYNKATDNRIFPFVSEIPAVPKKQLRNWKPGKLSIVVPYFNTGKYIAETIQSIYETAYDNKEVIVVNDGSDDAESLSILYLLQEQYKFQIVTQTNQGLAAARNTGVRNARGEFIAFLDADDKIDPDFYTRAIDILGRYGNVSFVSSWVRYFDGSQGIWPAQNPEPPFMLLHNMVNAGFLCRTSDYYNFGMNDAGFEYGMEDYDANLSLLENGCRGIVIPEPLYYYRIHAASMARGFNKLNQLFLYRLLSHKHKDLYSKYAPEVFNLLLANGPSYLYDNPTWQPNTDVPGLWARIAELERELAASRMQLAMQGNEAVVEMKNVSETIPYQSNHTMTSTYHMEKYNEVLTWYHDQYEVLPLWYKRFGHLIKVAKGKKSIKSLFKK